MSDREFWITTTIIVLTFGIFGGLIGLKTFHTFSGQTTVKNVKVKQKEAVPGNNNGEYLFFTKRDEVFSNNDNLIHLKFDSSDVYSKVEKGNCYNFKVHGFRMHFPVTLYRNVLSIKEVTCQNN
jgi:hypothetical protein